MSKTLDEGTGQRNTAHDGDADALITLLRLRPSQLGHFGAIVGSSTALTVDHLAALQNQLLTLSGWLSRGADDPIRLMLTSLTGPERERERERDSATIRASDLGETTFVDMAILSSASRLTGTPFRSSMAVPPPQQSLHRHPQMGATTGVDVAEVAAAAALLPPATNLPMTIGDYASLVAHTEPEGPAASGTARQKRHEDHGVVDEAHRASIDALFARYFSDQAAALADYRQALQRWRSWLTRGASSQCV